MIEIAEDALRNLRDGVRLIQRRRKRGGEAHAASTYPGPAENPPAEPFEAVAAALVREAEFICASFEPIDFTRG